MNISLLIRALSKYLFGLLLIIILLFIPAGSISFYNAWLFIILLFIPMLILGIILYIKNPNLLELRINAKEKKNEQKVVVTLSALMFIIGFVLAGLNYRYNWLNLPKFIIVIAAITFLISYFMYSLVLKQNTYLSRTIETTNNQKVITTGFYKIVRHPMYSITIILFLMIPLILNSLISFLVFLIYPIIIVIRINNEEKLLEKELKGYKEYEKNVKYRLIPYIW